jgi:hypothetical protein
MHGLRRREPSWIPRATDRRAAKSKAKEIVARLKELKLGTAVEPV